MDLLGGGGGAGWGRIISFFIAIAWGALLVVAVVCLLWWIQNAKIIGLAVWISVGCAFAAVAILQSIAGGAPIPIAWAGMTGNVGTPQYMSAMARIWLFDALCGFCVVSLVAVILDSLRAPKTIPPPSS